MDKDSSRPLNVIFRLDLIFSVAFGAFLLLVFFQRECVDFSGSLETILIAFEKVIQGFARVCAFIPEALRFILNFPAPKSDVWQIAFTLAIFHQVRTLPVELSIKKRVVPAWKAFGTCAPLGAVISYCFGILVSEPEPFTTSLFIALLYGFLELVRYTILAATYRKGAEHKFSREFYRRNKLYTLPYTLIGILSALISYKIFGTSPALLPFFALILFFCVALWLLVVEVSCQVLRALDLRSDEPFLQSTRTQTLIVFFGACGLCLSALYGNARVDLLDFAKESCTKLVQ